MTDLDLDALEAVAKAATPGPWEALGRVVEAGDWRHGEIVSCEVECGSYCQGGTGKGVAKSVDATHIATFNPSTVLELIAYARSAREAGERILADASEMSRTNQEKGS